MNPAQRQSTSDLRKHCLICRSDFGEYDWFGPCVPVLEELRVIGAGRRRVLCPTCGAIDRHRLILLYLMRKTALLEEGCSETLLHIAPEIQLRWIFYRCQDLGYRTGDLLRNDVNLKLDLTNMEIADGEYGVVLCNHVLEHIEDDRRAMREIHRVLKPGGVAVLQVPYSEVLSETYEDRSITSREDRHRHFGQPDHVRIYALADYVRRLEAAGFAVSLYGPQDLGYGDSCERFGLNEKESLIIAARP